MRNNLQMDVIDIIGGVEGGEGGCDDGHDVCGVMLVFHGVPGQQCFKWPVVAHVLDLVEQHGRGPLPVSQDLEEHQQHLSRTFVILV